MQQRSTYSLTSLTLMKLWLVDQSLVIPSSYLLHAVLLYVILIERYLYILPLNVPHNFYMYLSSKDIPFLT